MKDEALRLALEVLGHFEKAGLATLKTIHAITAIKQALEQPEPEPVAWLQFKDNEPPVVAPRNLGTPVFLGGIRSGFAHDAGEKK